MLDNKIGTIELPTVGVFKVYLHLEDDKEIYYVQKNKENPYSLSKNELKVFLLDNLDLQIEDAKIILQEIHKRSN